MNRDRLERLAHLSRGFTYAESLAEILRYAAEQAADLLAAAYDQLGCSQGALLPLLPSRSHPCCPIGLIKATGKR